MNLIITDGGKREAGIYDAMDCTVRALAIALDIPYYQAHKLMRERAGRKNWKGTGASEVVAALKDIGLEFNAVQGSFYRWSLSHKQGTYYVMMRKRRKLGHAIAIKDGVIYDDGPLAKGWTMMLAAKIK